MNPDPIIQVTFIDGRTQEWVTTEKGWWTWRNERGMGTQLIIAPTGGTKANDGKAQVRYEFPAESVRFIKVTPRGAL